MNVMKRGTAHPATLMSRHSTEGYFVLAVAFVLVGCGRQGGLRDSGTGPVHAEDVAAGGSGGNDDGGDVDGPGATAGGGSTTSQAGGGVPSGGTGGATTGAVGGASLGGSVGASSSTGAAIAGGSVTSRGGGAGASGGVTSRGGSAGASAAMSGGGSTAFQGGGAVASGGTSGVTTGPVGGASLGGSAGGRSRGGATTSGGATSLGGSGGSGSGRDGGVPDGGIVASGYCTGTSPKVTYLGQTVAASATNYQSSLFFGCCRAFGVNLHTSASLGLDFQVEVITPGGVPGDYQVGTPGASVRAPVRKSNESPQPAADNASGDVRIGGVPSSIQAGEFGLCLEVDDPSSALQGTRIYVPSVTILPYSEWNKRFQIYLLQDSSIMAPNAAALALDSLVLAAQPLLDLSRIAYVEQATTRIGLNPGQKLGDSLRSQLGTPLALPFVVLADGVRVYLGTFTSQVSSIAPVGPYVSVEGITSDGFVIQPPLSGADLRNDARILKALTEAGKLVP